VAQAAINAAPAFVANDPIQPFLNSLSWPEWSAAPTDAYLNSANGYATAGGATLPASLGQPGALLQEYGCTHILVRTFQRPQRSVTAVVYCFVNPLGAYGAYTTMRSGSQTIVVRGDASSEDDRSVSFWKGRHLVLVGTDNDDDDTSKALVSKLADSLCRAIDGHAQLPPVIARLPILDRVSGSEKFFLGPQATRQHISVPHLAHLYIDKASCAGMAEYQFSNPFNERMKALVIEFADARSAADAFGSFNSSMAEDHKLVMIEPNTQLCKLSGTYAWCGLRGTRVCLVTGARHKQSAALLGRELSY
jgi:hypothetical protein